MKTIRVLPFLLFFVAAPRARAEEPMVGVSERLTMPKQEWHVFVPVEVDASRGHGLEPVSLAPDVWYGLKPRLTIGLVHSSVGRTGFYGRAGDGLCVTGKDKGCKSAYNNVGFEGRYHAYQGRMTISANAGLHVVDVDVFATALKIGAVGALDMGMGTQVIVHPNLSIGLNERRQEMTPAEGEMPQRIVTNGEVLHLPVTVIHTITSRLQLAWQIGLGVPLQDAENRYFVPATAALQWAPTEKVALIGAFTFKTLIGGDEMDDGLDERAFTLGTILHL